MGCLDVKVTRIGGNVLATANRVGGMTASATRIGGNVSATANRVGGMTASATRVGGMTAWLGLICGPSLISPYLRVCDGGYVLTVDNGYIILNEPYNDLYDGD